MLAVCVASVRAEPAAKPDRGPDRFTASPEYRAWAIQKVRADDKTRAEAKAAAAQSVTIVENGQPKAVIVATPEATRAANVLQEWIKLMSGVTLPVTTDASTSGGATIYVGLAAVNAGLDLSSIQSATDEGIRIKADGKNVFIGAKNEAAAIRAVARFLEAEFGCRFFATAEWGRIYPKDQKTLKVMTQDFSEKPTISLRLIWGANGAFRHPYWSPWNGSGGEGIPTSHSWSIFPKDEFTRHPEYFRMDENGKRVDGAWYNLGHPDVRKRFVEWAVAYSENGQKNISLSPPDDHRFDHSPEARQFDNPKVIDPSSNLVSMTDRFMTIVNEAAKAIAAKGGKSKIGFYAYSDYTLPPTRPELDTLSPNILVNIAPIRFTRYHPIGHPNSPSAQALRDIIDGWVKRASMVGYRTYNYNLAEVLTPYSKISTWSHDVPYLQQKHCIAFNFESFDCWELSAPHLYLSIRLAYDPTQDPWAIMADFYDKFYGPAAEPMEKYWMAVDSAWINLKTEAGSIHALQDVYTHERIKTLDGYLAEAEKLAKDRPDADRVNLARRGLQRAQYWRAWYDALIAGNSDEAKRVYDKWFTAVEETFKARNGNDYEMTYLKRFVGGLTTRAHASIHPKEVKPVPEGAATQAAATKPSKGTKLPPLEMIDLPPRHCIGVLPDEWKYMTQVALETAGVKGDYFASDFDDSKWPFVKTYTNTLNGQGYPEYLGLMWYRTRYAAPKNATGPLWLHFVKADRKVTLFINGKQVGAEEQEAFGGVTINITGFLKAGEENQIAVRINHIPLPELNLGGIVAPIHLLAQTK